MRMHHHKKLSFFILQATLLSIHLPCFLSNKTITYNFSVPSCDAPFRCGSTRYLSYPFWGGDHPSPCGRPDSKLVCNGNVPMLNISPLSYRVKVIDFPSNTLKVAREDLWNNTCPKVLHNTTIDSDFFGYSPESKDQNVTLYYNCTSSDNRTLPNQFGCHGDDSNTKNFFKIGDPSSGLGFGITCNQNIFVPINTEAAESLKEPTASSINILQTALETGFSIKWGDDERQYEAPFCNSKVYNACNRRPNGRRPCGYGTNCRFDDPNSNSGGRRGPSPGSAAKSEGNNGQRGDGNSVPLARTTLGVILGIIIGVVVSIAIYGGLKRLHLLRGPNKGNHVFIAQDKENGWASVPFFSLPEGKRNEETAANRQHHHSRLL